MTEPTPGPWHWEDDYPEDGSGDHAPHLVGPDGQNVLSSQWSDYGIAGASVDKRLLAAAPELLAACELAFDDREANLDSVRAAIAKAKGAETVAP